MKNFSIAGIEIKPGERKRVMIETAPLYDFTSTNIPVEVIRGKKDGPVLFISAAIHGDEINGINIIHRLLKYNILKKIRGILIVIPIVNVFGFNTKTRYLPDRRDLNRCFPGNEDGSLASQLANIFMKEIVNKSTHGIDLHTGAVHRNNLPQVRGCFQDYETKKLAESFGAPIMIDAVLRDGSLREAAGEKKIKTILFEGGEALRFDENVTKIAIKGIFNVMEYIGMIEAKNKNQIKFKSLHAHDSHWLRAPYSGILQLKKTLGSHVKKKQVLGIISDPFGEHKFEIKAKYDGIIVGMSVLPLFNKGDAVFHVATFEDSKLVEDNFEEYQEMLSHADTFVL